MTATEVTVQLAASAGHNADENSTVLDVIRSAVGEKVERAMPPGTAINWHAGFPNYNTDYAQSSWGNGGYASGDVAAAGTWASHAASAWLSVLTSEPLPDLVAEVNSRLVSDTDSD